MHTKAPALVAVVIVFILQTCALGAPQSEFYGRVIGVADGDTITVLHDGRADKVRLTGIDAPESHQSFGNKAKQFTAKKCFGKDVLIKAAGADRYGRTLGEVILTDGTSVNQLLLKEGYAWTYRKYTNDPVLYLLEANARKKHSGLWADAMPVAPWDFRRGVTDTALGKLPVVKLRKAKPKKVKEPIG
jgi:micrococcal nuclease